MNLIICMLAPATAALFFHERYTKMKLDMRTSIIYLVIFAGFINLTIFAVVALVFGHREYVVDSALFTASFTTRYLALGFVLSPVVPWLTSILVRLIDYIRRNFEMKLIIEPNTVSGPDKKRKGNQK